MSLASYFQRLHRPGPTIAAESRSYKGVVKPLQADGKKMKAVLRVARLEDVPALGVLIPLSARGLQIGYYTSAQIEGALGTIFGVDTQLIRDGTYFVSEADGRIVGCGGWSRRGALFGADRGKGTDDSLLDPAVDAARVRAFFVHPDFARRGIGRMLMVASESAAIAAGFMRIDIVATLAGEPLYRAFGYAVVERYELSLPDGERLPVVRLTKSWVTKTDRAIKAGV